MKAKLPISIRSRKNGAWKHGDVRAIPGKVGGILREKGTQIQKKDSNSLACQGPILFHMIVRCHAKRCRRHHAPVQAGLVLLSPLHLTTSAHRHQCLLRASGHNAQAVPNDDIVKEPPPDTPQPEKMNILEVW